MKLRSRITAIVTMAMVGSLLALTGGATLDSASAAAKCYKGKDSYDKALHSYVTREGVGLVAWRTYLSASWEDKCSHGSLTVNIGFYDANIADKGGWIMVDRVEYLTSKKKAKWKVIPHFSSGLGSSYRAFQSHLDIDKNTRIKKVRVKTHLVFGQGSDEAVYSPRTVTMKLSKSKAPKKKKKKKAHGFSTGPAPALPSVGGS